LALNSNPQAFIALMAKLTDQNLTEVELSHWAKLLFYDHPTYNVGVKLVHPDMSGYFSLSTRGSIRRPFEAYFG
jgi:hypothetical protein